jgi:hypothetical protein
MCLIFKKTLRHLKTSQNICVGIVLITPQLRVFCSASIHSVTALTAKQISVVFEGSREEKNGSCFT